MKRSMTALCVVVLGVSLLGACGKSKNNASTSTTSAAAKNVSITIGAQDFQESDILAEIYAQALKADGYNTTVKKLGTNAFRDVELDAFKQNTINFAAEYAASMLEALNKNKGEATSDASATTAKLQTYLASVGSGLVALTPSDAVDTNSFVITQKTSDDLGIKSLSDLVSKGKDLRLGAKADCTTNPFCLPGLEKVYGLPATSGLVKNVQSLGGSQPIGQALDAKQIDVGVMDSTDSQIATKGYVLLKDDKTMLAADNVVPLVTKALKDIKGFSAAVDKITAALTTAELTDMNKKFDVDKEDPAVIAKEFLTAQKLL